jgi:predicted CXXCH cytochrome family protein
MQINRAVHGSCICLCDTRTYWESVIEPVSVRSPNRKGDQMRSLRLAVGLGALAAATAAWAYTGGTGLKGTPHDWSGSPTSLLQYTLTTYNADGTVKGTPSTSTYNCTGLTVPGVTSCALYTDASGNPIKASVTLGECTKCHTPHKAKTQALLWNHTLNAIQYKWEDPATTAGTKYATFQGDTYKGPTPKCLSCHDGLLASTDGVWFNRQVVSGSKYVAAAGSLDSGHEVANGTTGSMTGTHPVAMPYPLNGAVNTYNKVTNASLALDSGWVPDPTVNKIMLYNDDGSGNITRGAVAGMSGIECGSCHDVHNGSRVPAIASPLLVTGSISGNATGPGGYICQTCHAK